MGRGLSGWCIVEKVYGMPEIEPCQVHGGVAPGVFYEQRNGLVIRTYRMGESFFTSKREALDVLVDRLEIERRRHKQAAAYLAGQIQEALAGVEQEERERDGS